MARQRFSDEDVIRLLRQIEVETAPGTRVADACRSAGVSSPRFMYQFDLESLARVILPHIHPHSDVEFSGGITFDGLGSSG